MTGKYTRKLSYRTKMIARCALYNGCPENCRESLATPTATFPGIVNGLLLRSIVSYESAYKIWTS